MKTLRNLFRMIGLGLIVVPAAALYLLVSIVGLLRPRNLKYMIWGNWVAGVRAALLMCVVGAPPYVLIVAMYMGFSLLIKLVAAAACAFTFYVSWLAVIQDQGRVTTILVKKIKKGKRS